MDFMQILSLIIQICSALAVIIPLGIKLYKTVQELAQQKNWPRLVAAVSDYMAQAEVLLIDGADRKAWVMAMIEVTANQLNYPLSDADRKNLEDLIDQLCEMSKVVNPPITKLEDEIQVNEEAAE